MALHKRLWTREDLETRDIYPVDVGLAICGPLHHTRTLSLFCILKNRAQKILLGACHVIYVRLTSFYHRTHDRHSPGLSPVAQNYYKAVILLVDVVERPVTMTTTLKEQAWQSGLVLLDEREEWNTNDWPPLEGGWRLFHASVVLDHLDSDNNHKRQTVVVLGGYRQAPGATDSVLVLNLTDPDKQWREGPPMNKKRCGHAAVVCNGGVYVMGGGHRDSIWDCIERMDVSELLLSFLTTTTTHDSHWTTLTIRLSTPRFGCCAVAVHNRYIVVMGGYYNNRSLSSVDIIDTNNHIVIEGPSMTVPRSSCSSTVIGNRIFVVGGRNDNGNLDSMEYLKFAKSRDTEERKTGTLSTVFSFSSAWTNHSDLVLSRPRASCAVVAVGSCLVLAGGSSQITEPVDVLDTHPNHVWNLPPFGNDRTGFTMVAVANQVAVIGGWDNPTCATVSLMDKHTWCFQRLFEQQPNKWCLFREGRNIQHADISPFSTSTSAHKRARPDTRRGDEGEDGT